ncbi:hypothetical protein DRN85_08260 [Methanosarcinales archaeon]|nr:MAG: hypothetical protein DRN85_08260 [Methanosarcinales archaeon]
MRKKSEKEQRTRSMRASVSAKPFETREIVIKNPRNLDKIEVYKRDPSTYDATKNELKFNCNVSPSNKKCWRLVHWNGIIKSFFESEGYTYTINHLFCGTKEECLAEISRLGLIYDSSSVTD